MSAGAIRGVSDLPRQGRVLDVVDQNDNLLPRSNIRAGSATSSPPIGRDEQRTCAQTFV